jgi:hypothetical protein
MNLLPDFSAGTFEIRDALSVVVAGVGIVLAIIAMKLSKKQNEMSEFQYEQMKEQLTRKAILRLGLIRLPHVARVNTFMFAVTNEGDKTPTGYYWHLMVPAHRDEEINFTTSGIPSHHMASLFNTEYKYYNGYTDRPLFPTRSATFGRLTINVIHLKGPLELKWKLTSDDGNHPTNGWGSIKISEMGQVLEDGLTELPPWEI